MGLAGIGHPLPSEHVSGTNGQVVAAGFEELKEAVEVAVLDVAMDQSPALAVHDADALPAFDARELRAATVLAECFCNISMYQDMLIYDLHMLAFTVRFRLMAANWRTSRVSQAGHALKEWNG